MSELSAKEKKETLARFKKIGDETLLKCARQLFREECGMRKITEFNCCGFDPASLEGLVKLTACVIGSEQPIVLSREEVQANILKEDAQDGTR